MEKLKLISLGLAASIMVVTLVVHVVLGGPEINGVVQASDIPAEVKATSAVIWHMTTALIAFFVIATVGMIWRVNKGLALAVVGLEAVFALLFVGISLYVFSSLIALPQWTAFAAAAALTVPALQNWTYR